MSLPVSRNRTYTASTPAQSADFNDWQDRIIALHGGKHGDKVLHLPGIAAQPSFPGGVDDSLTRGVSGWTATTGAVGGDTVYTFLPIPLHRGDRIKSVAGFVYDNGAGVGNDVSLWRTTLSTGVVAQIGTTEVAVAGPAGYQTLSIDGLLEVVTTERIYVLRWNPAAGTDRFLGAEVTYDHP